MLRPLDAISCRLPSTRRSDVCSSAESVVNGVDEAVLFKVGMPATRTSGGFDKCDSTSGVVRSRLGVKLFTIDGLFGGSLYCLVGLVGGAPLEKLMGKRVRPGCDFLVAGLFPVMVGSLFMGLH